MMNDPSYALTLNLANLTEAGFISEIDSLRLARLLAITPLKKEKRARKPSEKTAKRRAAGGGDVVVVRQEQELAQEREPRQKRQSKKSLLNELKELGFDESLVAKAIEREKK